MRKNNIWWAVCSIWAMYSCSECMGDDAQEITQRKVDTSEDYRLNEKPYQRDIGYIKKYSEAIFGSEIFGENSGVLPYNLDEGENKIENFLYINNSIVLLGFFSSCFHEKIFLDLIIEELRNKDLESKLKTIFDSFRSKISQEIEKLKNNDKNNSGNHTAYSMVMEFNKIFNDNVLKEIIPGIIEAIEKDPVKKSKFDNATLNKYKSMGYMFGIAHVLLEKLISDRAKREVRIQKKYKELKLGE